jgi:hypothetical protein
MSSLLSHQAYAQSTKASTPCPESFHQLPVYPNAKLCQMFDDTFPATLTYHAAVDIDTAASFYIKALGKTNKNIQVKGRRVLHFNSDNPIIIISKDGQGSQVDVLMKQAL